MSKSVRVAAAVLIGALTLGACSSQGARTVPEGWQDERVGALRLAVPPGWERVEDVQGDYWTDAWQLVEGGDVVAQLAVEYDVLSNGPKAGLVIEHLLMTMPQMPGYEVVERSPDPIDVDADLAHARYVYDGADGTQLRGALWAIGEGREQPAAVQLTGAVDDELIDQVGESLTFEPQ